MRFFMFSVQKRAFIASLSLVVAGLYAVSLNARAMVQDRAQVEAVVKDVKGVLDQSFYFFKAVGKSPSITSFDPATREISITMFGSSQPGDIEYVKENPQRIKSLIPIRQTVLMTDADLKKDKKFEGYREPVGEFVAGTLKALGLLDDSAYTGIPFVNEYKVGAAGKWVFRNKEQFDAFVVYLKKMFKLGNISPAAVKPVLVVKINSSREQLSADDFEWVSNYYTVLPNDNDAVRGLYARFQEDLNNAQGLMTNRIPVGRSAGEEIFSEVEKIYSDFKTKPLIAMLAKQLFVAYVVKKLWEGSGVTSVKEEVSSKVEKKIAPYAIYGAGALAMLVAYQLVKKGFVDEENPDVVAMRKALEAA